MSERTFEQLLAEQLRVHADGGVRPIDPRVIAEATIATGTASFGRRWSLRVTPRGRTQVAVALLVLALTAAAVVVGAGLLRPPTAPLGGKLVFGTRDGLVVAEPDGSDSRRIRDDGPYHEPRWSVSGAYIAVSTVTDADANVLRVVRPDGTLVREIPRVLEYRWSPIGDALLIHVVGPFDAAVLSHANAPLEAGDHGAAIVPMPGVVVTAGVEAGIPILALGPVAEGIETVAWSHEGMSTIVFSRAPGLVASSQAWESTYDPDGGFSGGLIESWPGEVTSATTAHHDDRLVAIVRSCPPDVTDPASCATGLISITSTDSGVVRSAIHLVGGADPGTRVAWSPDDRSVLVSIAGDIFLAAADGSGATRLTTGASAESVVGWSPDSRRILFLRQTPAGSPDGGLDLWAMQPDGSDQVRLATRTLGADEGPSPVQPDPSPASR